MLQHHRARRKRQPPSVAKVRISKSQEVISFMSLSMVYKWRHLKDTEIVETSFDDLYLGLESKDTIFDLMIYLQAIKM
jgi:hypothetical protein